jgi:hypothetical protein
VDDFLFQNSCLRRQLEPNRAVLTSRERLTFPTATTHELQRE